MASPNAGQLTLAARLLRRFWPQLLVVALAGLLVEDLLLELAIRIGFLNHLAGLVALTLVVLVKLVAVVAMLEILRPALPALAAARDSSRQTIGDQDGGPPRFAAILTAALVPFFAYYAAWGFLGDTIREYSRLALTLDPFGSHGMVLDVLGGWWLILSVALAWVIRRAANAMKARSNAATWEGVIVVCEANWAFIGLYVLSRWKDDAIAWLAAGGIAEFGQTIFGWLSAWVASARAAELVPVEHASSGWLDRAQGVFFYGLLPVVWLTMAALIYGYDIHGGAGLGSPRVMRAIERYRSLPRFLRDFVSQFTEGYLKRYRALANGVRLTFTSSLMLILTLVVSYRLLDWLSAWAWFGLTRLVGAHELDAWQVIAHSLSLMLGSPSDPGADGVLILPIKICLLAATLERAVALGGRWSSGEPAGAEVTAQGS
ncbi:hypothetical protein SAMN05519104_2780 [Rhizobiales bacterium GAS188]|nr:hypothetical protein SAMN05519104_2780 [Rhizobiales bacterium GAS188]